MSTSELKLTRVAFGGGCHWCTEAMFAALIGVGRVEQGWVASVGEHASSSEAVIVHFDPARIDLTTLIAVHLATHSSGSMHALRARYRSAIYTFDVEQARAAQAVLDVAQTTQRLITKVLPFADFVLNEARYLDYYATDPTRPFCETNIAPKLRLLTERFPEHVQPGFIR